MSLKVLRPGLLTTVQDSGRCGYQRFGVSVSGAMDPFALRLANLLVGNDEGEGVLEMTLYGPELEFQSDCLISICGGNLSPMMQEHPVPLWRPVLVRRGGVLKFGEPLSGCRAYLAVAGGFRLPRVMGSMSTYLRARLGGYEGRKLETGDLLHLRSPSGEARRRMNRLESKNIGLDSPFAAGKWTVAPELLPTYEEHPVIRVIRGGQFDDFTEESKALFFSGAFQVTSRSDRMGYRLIGPELKLAERKEMLSEAVGFGTVQVPAGGNPIVLLADRQTIGGYPKIAEMISVDLPVIAQVRPGASIQFKEVTLDEAHELNREREKEFRLLKMALLMKE